MFKHYFELIENVSIWPVVSLSIFFGFFLLMILWLFRVDKSYLQKMKNLPLNDDAQGESGKSQTKPKPKLLLLLLLFISSPITLSAQDSGYSGMDQETLVTWLVLIVVVIAILVLMVAIYTLSVLKMALDQKSVATTTEDSSWTKLWDRLNKRAPREKEASIMLDHNYDGIRELDNHLPPWWTAFFYISIVYGVIYMFVYHVFDMAPLPGELYEISVAEANTAAAERLAEAGEEGGGIDESTVAFSDDPAVIDSGKKIYDMQCASCHRDDGGGGIGPNFTDDYWLHGGSISDIYKTIKYGVPQKGMISWEPLLSPEQMRDVSSYIMTMAGSDPPNAKAPQGDLYEEGADDGSGETETGDAEESQGETV